MIKYSIIIPAYNLEEYIVNTLDAIVAKLDFTNTEVIVVDDGSTDNTLDILQKYQESFDTEQADKLTIITQTNGGVSVARNKGIDVAKGEYIVFVDGDDVFNTSILEKAYNALNTDETQADMAVWGYELDDLGVIRPVQTSFAKEKYTNSEFLQALLNNENRVRIGSFAVKKELLDKNNIRFTEGCAIGEDVELIYKSVLSSKQIAAINDIGYTYVKREGSALNTLNMRKFEACYAMERIVDYAKESNKQEVVDDESIMDSLENGLYITHSMYAFENCMRSLHTRKEKQDFWNRYKEQFDDIEKNIVAKKKRIKTLPQVFSKKRMLMFLFSRKLYLTIRTFC